MMPLCTTRHAAVLAEVRVGVDVVGGAVGGPPGVADARRGGRQRASPRSPSRGWPACRRACRRRSRRRRPGRCRRSRSRGTRGAAAPRSRRRAPACRRRTPRSRTWRASLGRGRPTIVTRMPNGTHASESSPYVELDRDAWAALGAFAAEHRAAADRRGDRAGPGSRRRAGPRRGAAGLPAAVAAAEPVRRGGGRAAPRDRGLPAPEPAAAHAVRDRAGRVGGGRQVHDRPRAPADAGPLARAPAGRAGHDRRLPAAQRRAPASRDPAPQGLPRVLRPQGAAEVRHRHQVRQGRGRGADVLPPHLRRRPRREGRRLRAPTSSSSRGSTCSSRRACDRTGAPAWR